MIRSEKSAFQEDEKWGALNPLSPERMRLKLPGQDKGERLTLKGSYLKERDNGICYHNPISYYLNTKRKGTRLNR